MYFRPVRLRNDTLDRAHAGGDRDTRIAKRLWVFTSWIGLFSLLFARPLASLGRMSFSQDDASYLIVIPCITVWVFVFERDQIFVNLSFDRIFGGILLFLAVCFSVASHVATRFLSPDLQLSAHILALVLFWISGFALIFGKRACRVARFPLLFLLLMVPLPQALLDHVIYLLQVGSACITGALFDVLGVPVLRQGLIFHLANVNIEVAKECSGIRSSMAVLIITLLVVHLSLRTFWKRSLFLAAGLFIMIVKNGIRIASLTLLAMYVDPSFLHGRLHHQGGVVFFVIGLLLLLPVLKLLQHGEHVPVRN